MQAHMKVPAAFGGLESASCLLRVLGLGDLGLRRTSVCYCPLLLQVERRLRSAISSKING